MFKLFKVMNYILAANVVLFVIGYGMLSIGESAGEPSGAGALVLMFSKFAVYYPGMLLVVVSFAYYKARKKGLKHQHPKYAGRNGRILRQSMVVVFFASLLNIIDTVYIGYYGVFGAYDVIINIILMALFLSMCSMEHKGIQKTKQELDAKNG